MCKVINALIFLMLYLVRSDAVCKRFEKKLNVWHIDCTDSIGNWIHIRTDAKLRFCIQCNYNMNPKMYKMLPKLPQDLFEDNFQVSLRPPCPLPEHYSIIADKFPPIKFVFLSYLNISRIPVDFFDNSSVQTLDLDLRKTKLKFLSQKVFLNLTKLEKINLSSNRFRTLPSHLFLGNKYLKHFILNNNDNVTLKLVDGLLSNKKSILSVTLKYNMKLEIGEGILKNSGSLADLTLTGSIRQLDE